MGHRSRALEDLAVNPSFWHGRHVFVTGHTGFKGSWLCLLLTELGARVTGYALAPDTEPSLFERAGVAGDIDSIIGDMRDLPALRTALDAARPEVVLHLAAQALVRRSYDDPVGTYAVNVMGTVNLLEAVRSCASVRAVVAVTSDKCYENDDAPRAFSEGDPLGGQDPYSSSKACAELVCAAYRQSFLSLLPAARSIGLASARAGNVIGGGDWAVDRLVPDLLAAIDGGRPLILRNPQATRPWQHVLEPLAGYLLLAERLHCEPARWAGAWNFGPAKQDVRNVQEVVDTLAQLMGRPTQRSNPAHAEPHEARCLALDSSKAREQLGWAPRWDLQRALSAIVEWHGASADNAAARAITLRQITRYLAEPVSSPAPRVFAAHAAEPANESILS